MDKETTTPRGLGAWPQLVAESQIHIGQGSMKFLWVANKCLEKSVFSKAILVFRNKCSSKSFTL